MGIVGVDVDVAWGATAGGFLSSATCHRAELWTANTGVEDKNLFSDALCLCFSFLCGVFPSRDGKKTKKQKQNFSLSGC